jgi:hypothetical protein
VSNRRRNIELKTHYNNTLTQPRRGTELKYISLLHLIAEEPQIILTDTDTGGDSRIDCQSVGGSMYFDADYNNEVALTSIGMGTDGSRYLYLTGSKIGIGTYDPGSLLHLYGFTPEIRLTDTTTSSDEFVFGNSNGNFFVYNTTDSRDDFYIDGDGKVGIGTSSPAHKVDIDGNLRFGKSTQNGSVLRIWDNNDADIDGLIPGTAAGAIWESTENSHAVVGIRGNDNNDGFYVISGGGNYMTDDTYDTLVASFKADGKVGIGITTPDVKLHISSSATSPSSTASMILEGRAGANHYGYDDLVISNFAPGIRLRDTSTNSVNYRLGVQGNKFQISIDTDYDDVQDFVNNGHYDDIPKAFTVKNNGNVGLGTDDPGSQLHLYGFTPEVRLTDLTTSSDEFVLGNSNGNFFVYNTTDARNDFYITGDGKVGIGAIPTTHTLEVNGDILCAGGTLVFSDGGSTNRDFFQYNESGITGLNTVGGYGFFADTSLTTDLTNSNACIACQGIYNNGATEALQIVDAGSTGASSSGAVVDWIEVVVGSTTGYIKVYDSK